MVGRWSESSTLKFIYFYKLHDCLWDTKNEYYNNKDVRGNAYQDIVNQMRMEDFDVRGVKVKIKNLRAHYFTELKKVRLNAAMGNVYEPTVYWYRELHSFLKDGIGDIPSLQVPEVITADSIYDSSSIYENGDGYLDEDSLDKPLPVFHMADGPLRPKPKSAKRNYSRSSNGTPGPRKRKPASQQEPQDEFEVFGRSVAAQLRKLSVPRALKAQTRIQVILTEERLQDLESASPPPEAIETQSVSTDNGSCENTLGPESVPESLLEPVIEMTTSLNPESYNMDELVPKSEPHTQNNDFEDSKPFMGSSKPLPEETLSTSSVLKPYLNEMNPSFQGPEETLSTASISKPYLNERNLSFEAPEETLSTSSVSKPYSNEMNPSIQAPEETPSTSGVSKPYLNDMSLSFVAPQTSKKAKLPYERPKPACKKKKVIIEKQLYETPKPSTIVREIHIKPECDVITLDEDDPLEGTG